LKITEYYSIKNMVLPTPDIYGILPGDNVLLIGTARKQDWAIAIDIDPRSPCDILANGLSLPFADKSFDFIILDYVTNFLPKEYMINILIREASRVAINVVGRCTVTPGKRITLPGPKQRYSHAFYPNEVMWIN
jgi:hypothetical protein